ncbi:helix-turn-helix domain-containing protein [Aquabacterium parvum]|uniref:helix-turn-helix domain-containing protein n=1 Tax=Aquabacterium parvum TaxID=70584 RepID=UPI000718E412|nr:helix-turn-helix transcriptional regulator [Aquabacterium parvum]
MQKSLYNRHYQVMLAMLRDARAAANLTQVELAARLDVSQSDVSKIEQGTRRLDVIELRQWLQAIGIQLPQFISAFESKLDGDAMPSGFIGKPDR